MDGADLLCGVDPTYAIEDRPTISHLLVHGRCMGGIMPNMATGRRVT